MKFKAGDKTDTQHCKALQHEFLRCHDAYLEFVALATSTIATGDSRVMSYRMYNAYARFVHHLFEFMVGALVHDIWDTKIARNQQDQADKIELYITGHAARLLKNKRQAIEQSKAPGWKHALEALPTSVPKEFASQFRHHRNVIAGHVKYERASLKLTEFFNRYQFFMFLLYRDSYYWWGARGSEIPDLDEITAFSVLVKKEVTAVNVLNAGQSP